MIDFSFYRDSDRTEHGNYTASNNSTKSSMTIIVILTTKADGMEFSPAESINLTFDLTNNCHRLYANKAIMTCIVSTDVKGQ